MRHYRDVLRKNRDLWASPKREVVVYRVVKARDSLESAKVQFVSALDKFSALSNFDGASLKECTLRLQRELEISEDHAEKVAVRIRSVEEVSLALFDEWQKELDQYTNRQLRGHSLKQMKLARQHYNRLMRAMHQAESKIKPVLTAFRDQVLFLNHSLNAQAIASLHHELKTIAIDIAALITAMERSIVEANGFVNAVVDNRVLPNPE